MNEPTTRLVGRVILIACLFIALFILLVLGMLSIAKTGKAFTLNDIYAMTFIVHGALVLLGVGLYCAAELEETMKGDWQ